MSTATLSKLIHSLINEDVESAKAHLSAYMDSKSKRLLEWDWHYGGPDDETSEPVDEEYKFSDVKDEFSKFNIDGKLFDFCGEYNKFYQDGIEDYSSGYINRIVLQTVIIAGKEYSLDFDTDDIIRASGRRVPDAIGAEAFGDNVNQFAGAFFQTLSDLYANDFYNEDNEHLPEPVPAEVGITLELCTKALSTFFKKLEELETDAHRIHP